MNAQLFDFRNREDIYSAIVSTTDATCLNYPEIAAHEVGHLLGAGHLTGAYLHPWSHAQIENIYVTEYIPGYGEISYSYSTRTIMVGLAYDPITDCLNNFCSLANYYSSDLGDYADNTSTLVTTALSVANYRVPPTPPQSCSLSVPQTVVGTLLAACYPSPPYTLHLVTWEDTCPDETLSYLVWGQQPPSNPPSYGWSTLIPVTQVYVWGADALIRISACGSGGCTGLSFISYLATSLCNW